jgi:Ca-activated chloride channel homolog
MPRILRLLVPLFVTVSWVCAQEPTYTLQVNVPLVTLDVMAQDGVGKPVTDLRPHDFEVYEDGVRQQIQYFSPVSAPYNIFLLVDRSGSTQHKWPFMQRAIAGFIGSLRPQDRIAIGAFDDETQLQLDWTSDRSKAILALPTILHPKTIGGTNFYQALDRSLRRAFRQLDGRRAVLVLTDGRDTSLYRQIVSTNRILDVQHDRAFQKLFKTARQQRIPTYFVALNTDKNLDPNTLGGDEYKNLKLIFPNSGIAERYLSQVRMRMDQVAEVSGGHTLFPNRLEDVGALYQQIGRELGLSYSLGYISSNNGTASGGFRQIEVRARVGQLRLSQSRSGYYAR